MNNKGPKISHDFLFNIVLGGSPGVEKSSFVTALTRSLTCSVEIEEKIIKVRFLDTIGMMEKFRSLMPSYYRDAQGAILLYDSSRRETFENIAKLLDDIRESSDPLIQIILVGSKQDSNESESELIEAEVTTEEAEEFARKNCVKLIQSGSDNENDYAHVVLEELVANIFKIVSRKPVRDKPVTIPAKPVQAHDYLFQLIVLGDPLVGKANLISRFVKDEFSSDSKGRVGPEWSAKSIELDNKIVKARIWNTNSLERFKEIRYPYYEIVVGALIVYDITKHITFQNIEKWLKEIQERADEDIVIMIVGNKTDLEDLREITTEEGEEFANKHQLLFIETSALDSSNIEKAFRSVLTDIYYKILSRKALNGPIIFPKQKIRPKSTSSVSSSNKKQSCQVM